MTRLEKIKINENIWELFLDEAKKCRYRIYQNGTFFSSTVSRLSAYKKIVREINELV